jgi:hypothetical protein|tara:strand:- start:10748 stop:11059 length:312 start_codon:yes stop_codon:yes gene_type:complete
MMMMCELPTIKTKHVSRSDTLSKEKVTFVSHFRKFEEHKTDRRRLIEEKRSRTTPHREAKNLLSAKESRARESVALFFSPDRTRRRCGERLSFFRARAREKNE